MDLTEALDFIRDRKQGVLVTIRANGRPQLSNILYLLGDDGVVRISVTDDRAKTANLRRDPRASLYVLGDNFYQYVVVEAAAELMPVAADPHDATVDALVEYYRVAMGEHPDWDEYRASMVNDKRLVLHAAAGAGLRDGGAGLRRDAGVPPSHYGQDDPKRMSCFLIPRTTGLASCGPVLCVAALVKRPDPSMHRPSNQ